MSPGLSPSVPPALLRLTVYFHLLNINADTIFRAVLGVLASHPLKGMNPRRLQSSHPWNVLTSHNTAAASGSMLNNDHSGASGIWDTLQPNTSLTIAKSMTSQACRTFLTSSTWASCPSACPRASVKRSKHSVTPWAFIHVCKNNDEQGSSYVFLGGPIAGAPPH